MKTKAFRISDIKWDTDNEDITLPNEVYLTVTENDVDDIDDEEDVEQHLSDKLTDKFGFCHDGFSMIETPVAPITIGKVATENDRTYAEVTLYNGKTYRVRVISDKDGNDYLIAGDEIDNDIHPGEWEDDNNGFDPANPKSAEKVYDEIFFFTDDTTLDYTDELLRKDMHEQNPDYGFDY